VGLSVFADGFAPYNRMFGALTGLYATLSNLNIRVREQDRFIMPIGFGSRGAHYVDARLCIYMQSDHQFTLL
jgi:hypothetical protein